MFRFVFLCFACVNPVLSGFLTDTSQKRRTSPVMIVTGATSPQELCLTAGDDDIAVMPCMLAIAAGDGRELFMIEDGHISSVKNGNCFGISGDGIVKFLECDGTEIVFEMEANNQLLAGGGNGCLSFRGTGQFDAALHAAVSVSSTVEVNAHGPRFAVDGLPTYWASKFDPEGAIEFVVDVGRAVKCQTLEISWEFPAKSFSVLLSADGQIWEEVYSTDVNALSFSRVVLRRKWVLKVKVILKEPHPIYGHLHGHRLFGISSISLLADNVEMVVEDCVVAASHADARDKFFITAVNTYNLNAAKDLHGVVPTFELAQTGLATTTAVLNDVIPRLENCKAVSLMSLNSSAGFSWHSDLKFANRGPMHLNNDILEQSDVDIESTNLLLQESRGAILKIRSVVR